MSNFAIADQPGLCQLVTLKGIDSTGTQFGLANTTVTISDTTNGYVAAAPADAQGRPQFYIVPRQNCPGGTPLTSVTTISVIVNAKDPVLGGTLSPITFTCDFLVQAPPPAHSTAMAMQSQTQLTPSTIPADPGTAMVTLN